MFGIRPKETQDKRQERHSVQYTVRARTERATTTM